MRRRLEALGAPVPRFAAVTSVDDVEAFAARSAGPSSSRPCAAATTAAAWCWPGRRSEARDVVARLPGRRRARCWSRSGWRCGASWPRWWRGRRSGRARRGRWCETVQRDGICVTVIAPAPGLADGLASAASELALRLASELGVVGVLAVELFETVDGALLVNELAMRPHNSGHWTMDGAAHRPVRAAPARGAGLPAGRHRADGAGHGDGQRARAHRRPRRCRWTNGCTTCSRGCPTPGCTCTARSERPGRKIGHVNMLGRRRFAG